MSPRRLSDDPAAARIALSLILAVAFAWRLVAVAFPVTDLVSDSALYGLMTRHMLEGRFPLFTYGQHYMGSLESVVGAFFSLFVGPSFRALQLSPLLFFMLFLGVLWRLGRELFGPVPALWAVAYAAASPFPLYAWSMSPRGGYPETLFFGTAVLLLALLILRRGGGGKAEWVLLGLLSGLGFWTNFLIGYYFLPAGVVLAVGLRRELFRSRTYLGIGAFLVGSLPVWIYNIPRGFPSFRMGALGSFDQAAGLRIFFVRQLPDILGLSGSYLGNHPLAQRVWFVAAAAFYLLLALPFAWVSIKALAAFLTRRRPAPDEGLLLLFLATMALLFSGSRYALFNTSRYLVPVYSVVPLIGASAIARTSGVRRRLVCAGWAALMVVQSVFLAKHLSSTYPVARRDEALTNELLATLVAEGETHGVSEYSQSKRLTYISGERVIVIQPRDDQYPPYEAAVERSPRAFFLTGNPQLPKLLAERGVRFRERRFGGRLLLSAIEPPGEALVPIARAGWKLTGAGAVQGWADGLVGPAPAPAPAAVNAAAAQAPEETLIDLGEVRTPTLARVLYDSWGALGSWEAWSSTDGASWTPVLAAGARSPVFVSAGRAYDGGLFVRAELRLTPVPARFVRLRRTAVPGRRQGRVDELYLYESRERGAFAGIPGEAVAFLREQAPAFVWADRWESAALGAALGAGRASVPFNRVAGGEDRTGVVQGGERVAFLVPATEAGLLREVLAPGMVAAERDFGDYRALVAELPGQGSSGARWTGFSLVLDGREDSALRRRRED